MAIFNSYVSLPEGIHFYLGTQMVPYSLPQMFLQCWVFILMNPIDWTGLMRGYWNDQRHRFAERSEVQKGQGDRMWLIALAQGCQNCKKSRASVNPSAQKGLAV